MRNEAPGEARGTASPGTASPQSTPSGRPAVTERSAATFEAYYWEAYNEIVQPHKIDLYLIDCWLPHLGPLGFALVKALRRRCYYNPKQGVVRNEVEIDIAELAASVGVNKATVYRELERNESLQQFVRLQSQYASTAPGRAPKRVLPQFLVCMDDPIHSNDLDRYENLRARKELERASGAAAGTATKWRMKPASGETSGNGGEGNGNSVGGTKSQFATKADLTKSQIATKGGTKSQFATPESHSATDAPYSPSLPSEIFTKDLFTSSTDLDAQAHPISPINPPRGKENSEVDTQPFNPLQAVWNVALSHLSGLVNAPTLNAHIKPIRVVEVSDGAGETPGEAVLLLASAFSRTWVETRCRAEIEAALTEALGRPVTAKFTVAGGK